MIQLPFTYPWIMKKLLRGDAKTVLDVGCWKGRFLDTVNENNKYSVVGIDIVKAPARDRYKSFVICTGDKLPFKNNSFDITVSNHVIEHLDKKKGLKFIQELERVASKQTVISTPVGFVEFMSPDEDMKHISGWEPTNSKQKITKFMEIHGGNLLIITCIKESIQ